jgi:hypothetical protein
MRSTKRGLLLETKMGSYVLYSPVRVEMPNSMRDVNQRCVDREEVHRPFFVNCNVPNEQKREVQAALANLIETRNPRKATRLFPAEFQICLFVLTAKLYFSSHQRERKKTSPHKTTNILAIKSEYISTASRIVLY